MLPQLGEFSLVLAACLAILASVLGLLGGGRLLGPGLLASRRGEFLQGAVSSLVVGQLVFCALAFVALVLSFVQDDFSVAYVAGHSNSLLPWAYKVSATWGGHEGSFLLWILTMTVWMVAVVLRRNNYPASLYVKVMGVLSLLNLGFLAFALLTSNPFIRLIPMTPADGADLNPLLQDFGLIVHPPMLYAGYVGLAVPFAFAVAAMLENRVDAAWARWSRSWSNFAWAFLTVGIALGSWWAYYELGWGGWWFWDPSENASFMPWLAATALIHSLAVTEKRGTFKSWTLLLAITGFSLSLLGGFIIRSGVLTSVHAFAVDPQRGVFILAFLAVVVGGALALYAMRAGGARAEVSFALFSREFFVLANNVLLVIALAVVLWGTLAPIGYQLGGNHISIGAPFFNAFFVPLMLALAALLSILPALNWKRSAGANVLGMIQRTAPIAVLAALLVYWWAPQSTAAVVAIAFAVWLVASHGYDLWQRWRAGSTPPLAYWGMTMAHLGFAVSITGVAVTSTQSIEEDVRMVPASVVKLGTAEVRFAGVSEVKGPNYVAQQGLFMITPESGQPFALRPEKRRYLAGGNIMTEAGIRGGLFADTYISLGEPLNGGAWAVRLHYKPLVRWVWLGALLMACGGVLAVFDVRYRRLRRRLQAQRMAPRPTASGNPVSTPVGKVST